VLYIFTDGLRRLEVQADGPALVALLVQANGRLFAVPLELRNL
jgi:hypothetical protein